MDLKQIVSGTDDTTFQWSAAILSDRILLESACIL